MPFTYGTNIIIQSNIPIDTRDVSANINAEAADYTFVGRVVYQTATAGGRSAGLYVCTDTSTTPPTYQEVGAESFAFFKDAIDAGSGTTQSQVQVGTGLTLDTSGSVPVLNSDQKWNGATDAIANIDQTLEDLGLRNSVHLEVNASVTNNEANPPTITSTSDATTSQLVGGWDTRLTDARGWNGTLDGVTAAAARSTLGCVADDASELTDARTWNGSVESESTFSQANYRSAIGAAAASDLTALTGTPSNDARMQNSRTWDGTVEDESTFSKANYRLAIGAVAANDSALSDARAWDGTLASGVSQSTCRSAIGAVSSSDSALADARAWNGTLSGVTAADARTTLECVASDDSALSDARAWDGTLASGVSQSTCRTAIGAISSSNSALADARAWNGTLSGVTASEARSTIIPAHTDLLLDHVTCGTASTTGGFNTLARTPLTVQHDYTHSGTTYIGNNHGAGISVKYKSSSLGGSSVAERATLSAFRHAYDSASGHIYHGMKMTCQDGVTQKTLIKAFHTPNQTTSMPVVELGQDSDGLLKCGKIKMDNSTTEYVLGPACQKDVDTSVTTGSAKLITSDAVHAALSNHYTQTSSDARYAPLSGSTNYAPLSGSTSQSFSVSSLTIAAQLMPSVGDTIILAPAGSSASGKSGEGKIKAKWLEHTTITSSGQTTGYGGLCVCTFTAGADRTSSSTSSTGMINVNQTSRTLIPWTAELIDDEVFQIDSSDTTKIRIKSGYSGCFMVSFTIHVTTFNTNTNSQRANPCLFVSKNGGDAFACAFGYVRSVSTGGNVSFICTYHLAPTAIKLGNNNYIKIGGIFCNGGGSNAAYVCRYSEDFGGVSYNGESKVTVTKYN